MQSVTVSPKYQVVIPKTVRKSLQKGTVVDLNAPMAIKASKLSLEYNLPMADGIILATAQEFKAVLWTQDSDFKRISNVKYFPKK